MDKDKFLINEEPILLLTLYYCGKLDDLNSKKADLRQCASLMAGNERIAINKTDGEGNTALHIALKYGLEDIAMTICTKHPFALLGVCNNKDETALDFAKHEFLEEYLDKTVKTYGGNSKEFNVDYNGFCPYISKRIDHQIKIGEKIPKKVTNQQIDERKILTAIGCIEQISDNSQLKPLLNHPVIKIYVQIQWLHWNIWHVINLFLTFGTVFCFVSYTLKYFCHGNFSIPLQILSGMGCFFVFIREVFQLAVFGKRYFRQLENCFDIANVVLIWIVLKLKPNDSGYWILLAVLSVSIFAYDLIYLLGALKDDIFSTYRCMFQVVAKNFFLSILAFCPILLAFYYSFYLVYNSSLTSKSSNSSEINPSNDTFNTFGTALDAGVKILVMTVGELDASTMEIDHIKVFIFIPFILTVLMIIQNLINGLAVSDISEIKGESELINLRKKVHLLARIESGLDRENWLKNILKMDMLLQFLPEKNYSKLFFKKYSHFLKVIVDKNDCAKIMIQRRKKSEKAKRRDQSLDFEVMCCANKSKQTAFEARYTNGENSQLLPGRRDETQDIAISIPETENPTSQPSTIEREKSTPEPWLYVLRIPMPESLRKKLKILPIEARLNKSVLRNLQRIDGRNQTKVPKELSHEAGLFERKVRGITLEPKLDKTVLRNLQLIDDRNITNNATKEGSYEVGSSELYAITPIHTRREKRDTLSPVKHPRKNFGG